MNRTRCRLSSIGSCLALWVVGAGPVLGQSPLTEHTVTLDDPDARYALTLDDAEWLVGTWRGEGFGGTVEEVWLPAAHEQMIGAFRYYGQEEEGFSELMTLTHIDGQTLLRVKHFNPDFTGWETQDESEDFRFVGVGHRALHFRGLTLVSASPDVLDIYIAMRGSNGELREEALRYRRVSR
jgi:hypothetical protein